MDTYDILGTIGIACLVILLIILIWWLWRRTCREKNNQANSARSTDGESQINNRISEETPINVAQTTASSNNYGADNSSDRYGDPASNKELPPYHENIQKTKEENVVLENNNSSTSQEISDTLSLSRNFGNEAFNKHLPDEARVNRVVKSISLEEQNDIPLNGENTASPKAAAVKDISEFVETNEDDVQLFDLPAQLGENLASIDPKVEQKLQKLKEIERDAIGWAEMIPEALKNRRQFLNVREMLLRGIDAVDLTYANGIDVIKEEKRRVIAYIDNQVNELESKKPIDFV